MLLKTLSIAGFVSAAFAGTATTTNYYDGQLGACGCGTVFNSYVYTAAGSQALFGTGTWCGSGCGNCYVLTSTGVSPPGQGTGSAVGSSIIVAVTNLCPNAGNANWCPNIGGTNAYGYTAHFDINNASGNGGWSSLGWNNPIVNYQPIACPSPLPTLYANAATCECPMTNIAGASSAPTGPTTTGVTTSTSTTTKATSTSTTSGATQTHYGQCGGIGWTGPTVCASGSTCTVSSPYYSQCL